MSPSNLTYHFLVIQYLASVFSYWRFLTSPSMRDSSGIDRFLLNPGDSSLRFGMTIFYFAGVGKEVAIRLKISNRDKTEFANRHFFPPISQTHGVIPSSSEGSPALLWNVVISNVAQRNEESPINMN
jgi:hypothetical protein